MDEPIYLLSYTIYCPTPGCLCTITCFIFNKRVYFIDTQGIVSVIGHIVVFFYFLLSGLALYENWCILHVFDIKIYTFKIQQLYSYKAFEDVPCLKAQQVH